MLTFVSGFSGHMAGLAEMERELVCERGIRTRLDAVSRIRKWICVVAPDALICRVGRAPADVQSASILTVS